MPPKGRKTRQSSGDFGPSSELPEAGALPTTKDVVASINFEIEKSTKQKENEKEKEAIDNVTNLVLSTNNSCSFQKFPYLMKKQ